MPLNIVVQRTTCGAFDVDCCDRPLRKQTVAAQAMSRFGAATTARGRREIEAAAPGHVAAVRRLFVDRLTGEQLDAIGDAAEAVLAGFEASPGDADADRARA